MVSFRIRQALERTDHSEAFLAYMMGWDEQRTSRILAGIEGITAEELFNVATTLGVPMFYLLPDVAYAPGGSPRSLTAYIETSTQFYTAGSTEQLRLTADLIDSLSKDF